MSGLMSRLPMLLQSELQPDFFLKDQSKSLLGHPFEGGTVEENGHNMADYGAAWRYQTDGRRTTAPSATPPGKRTRRDYEDVQQARQTFGAARTAVAGGNGAGREVAAYAARDRAAAGYDDRAGRVWREGEGLQASDLLGYGAATLSANDLAMTGGPGMGLQVGGGGMGLNMGIDEATLMGQAGRMVGLDVGMGGRPASVGMNGVSQDTDVLRGNIDILPPDASATLFVDGLPLDCSRREAAHIFRPFIGFKEVRLVHKEAKRALGEKVVLCFVEFADARCAATALEALQGYKFDETDPDSYSLRLSFARHPGPRGPPPRDDYRGGRRDDDYGHRSRGRR